MASVHGGNGHSPVHPDAHGVSFRRHSGNGGSRLLLHVPILRKVEMVVHHRSSAHSAHGIRAVNPNSIDRGSGIIHSKHKASLHPPRSTGTGASFRPVFCIQGDEQVLAAGHRCNDSRNHACLLCRLHLQQRAAGPPEKEDRSTSGHEGRPFWSGI